MSYADAKAEIVTLLEGIQDSNNITIKRVYGSPPNTLQDLPCFVIYPAGIEPDERPNWPVDRYTVLMRLVAHDTDWSQAAAIIERYQRNVITTFRGNKQLGGYATVIRGPIASAALQFEYGLKPYLGMDFTLTVRIDDDGTISA